MSAITILNNNQPTGPFTREQVAQKLASGGATLDDLSFVEGLTAWTPLRDVLLKVDGKPPVPVTTPAHSYAVTMQPPAHLVYATFWERFFAYFIDSLILSLLLILLMVPVFALAGLLGAFSNNDNSDAAAGVGFVIGLGLFPVLIAASWLYFALLESSSKQGTFGKQLLGLKVADMEGNRLHFGRASLRFLGKIINGFLPLAIGYIMAAFTERKQALHDMIASTLVIK